MRSRKRLNEEGRIREEGQRIAECGKWKDLESLKSA
jgi:hypothetical protein